MCDPILVTLLKMQPYYGHSSRENATPSKGTSPLACYKEVPHPSPPRDDYDEKCSVLDPVFKFGGGHKQTKSLLLNLMNFVTISLQTDSPTSGKLRDLKQSEGVL